MADMTGETLEGYIEHIVYRNEENGYTVFSLVSEEEEVTCVGLFEWIHEGENVALTGRYTDHATYGRQFKAETMTVRAPKDAEAIERYLASGAIKGIGAILAKRIVRVFGDDTLRIIREEPERLSEVKGISERKAREIAARAAEQESTREAMMFLQKFGLSVTMCVRVYKAYGDKVYDIIRENPYKLAEDIDGIGFQTADEIAEKAGIPRESEYRIRAGIIYCLFRASADGHVYLPWSVLTDRARDLLQAPEDLIEKAVSDLAIAHKLVIKRTQNERGEEERRVYAGSFYYLELNCARRLTELNVICDPDEKAIRDRLKKLSSSGGIALDEEQQRAVILSAMSGLLILTGGPGTGKTTTINEMLRYFSSIDATFLLAAPTGRAARRMTEATGYEASTIHRLLEIGPSPEGSFDNDFRFGRNAMNPLEAEVIIIDEMSMVDISLMNALLMAVPVGARLILVGDADQLPSVGPGDVLCDMIRSGAFPTVRLKKIFRQAQGSDIVMNAHAINEGRQISLDTKSRDFFFLKRQEPEVILKQMIGFIRGKLPEYAKARPFEIQVLTPMKKGALGVENLNRVLQEHLNPADQRKREHAFGERLFRTGDKVMQIRNNYQLEWEILGRYHIPVDHGTGIFNGDMGIIREINDFASQMTIEFDGGRVVEYPYSLQEELELAYAITIHKSQGSEYPAVILPVLGGPRLLMTRNLLYTAVTRAKNCMVLMGDDASVRSMIENASQARRYTSLTERILEMSLPEEETQA